MRCAAKVIAHPTYRFRMETSERIDTRIEGHFVPKAKKPNQLRDNSQLKEPAT